MDAVGIEAFSRDGRRRIGVDGSSADARRWWSQLEGRRDPWDMLILAECILSAPATLDEFVEAISVTGLRGLEYAFLSLREKRAVARLRVTALSRTDGWEPFHLRLRLQAVKYQLGWLELDDPAREFWMAIEKKYAQQLELVLQLAEELAMRGSSITSYHEAGLRGSDPEDPRATLAYLDYLRLAATAWAEDTWPDDVSVGRWSYDTASPTFRDVSEWSEAQIARWLEVVRERIGFSSASERARHFWSALESTAAGATMVRLAEELEARAATVQQFFRAHVDAASDNLLAVLSYLDFALIAKARLSEDETVSAEWHLIVARHHFDAEDFAAAAREYEAAIADNPGSDTAYLYLALTYEKLRVDESADERDPVALLQRGVQHCPDSAALATELERFALHLPPLQASDPRSIAVEISESLVQDVDDLVRRAEGLREAVKRTVGMSFPGLRFRQNTHLEPGAFRVLHDEVPVSEGFTVPGRSFVLAPWAEPEPVWPRSVDRLEGEWRQVDEAGPDGGLSPHDFLLRQLRVDLAGLAARQLTQQSVLTMLDEGWSELDVADDLPLLTSFTDVLRVLLDDHVPITETDGLLDEYVPLHNAGVPIATAVERLRQLPGLRRRLPGNRPSDALLLLAPEIEEQLAITVLEPPSLVLRVPPELLHLAVSWIRGQLADELADRPDNPVLVVSRTWLRLPLRTLVRPEFAGLAVVAAEELLSREIA